MKTDKQEVAKLIKEAVDKGATTAEEIHRSIADLPITVLESLGLGDKTTQEVKKIQDTTIGAIYELVHDINHHVADLATDIISKVQTEKDEQQESEKS